MSIDSETGCIKFKVISLEVSCNLHTVGTTGDSLLTKTNTNIKREIIDVKIKDNEVNIVTVEGLVKDNKLYNVLSNQEITEYKGDNIINYRDKLNQLTYTFDNKKLSRIK